MNSSLRDIVVTAEAENKQNAAEISSLQKRHGSMLRDLRQMLFANILK